MIDTISASLLMVRDFDASLRFYRDILAFKVSALEKGFAAFDVGDKTLALLDLSMAAEMISEDALQPARDYVPRSLFAVFLEDCDAEYERLKAKGFTLSKLRSPNPGDNARPTSQILTVISGKSPIFQKNPDTDSEQSWRSLRFCVVTIS